MAINPYISSANVFVYPCANRKEGFWESKLATEYSLRTLIPWKVTKRSFVIADVNTAQELANKNNLEFVINGYYFNISDWKETIGYQNGTLWAHIKLAAKPLTRGGSTNEATEILALYNSQTAGILDDDNDKFQGIKFDQTAGTDSTTVFHLQIFDANGNILHRDMIKINCDDPLEQDDETGLLSLKYGNGLTLNNNTLITKLGNGLEFGSGTEGEKPVQIKLATNSGLTRDANGLKVINAVSDPIAANNILQSLKINNVTYTIPQGKTYTAGKGIQIDSNNIVSAKTDSTFGIEAIDTGSKIILADGSYFIGTDEKTVYSGLQFAVCTSNGESYKGLQIKLADSSLQVDSNGLAVKLETNSGLGKSSGLYVQLQSSGGLQKNNNGLGVKLPTGSGLETTTSGLQIKVNTASGLVLTSDGLKMKYPLPSIDGNNKKILAVTSDGTSLEWVEKPSGGGGTYSAGSGISINSNNAISVSLATNSGLEFSDSKLRLKKSNGINIDSNGVFIRLKNNSGLNVNSDGLSVALAGSSGLTSTVSGLAINGGTGETTSLAFTNTTVNANIAVTGFTYGDLMLLYINSITVTGSGGVETATCTVQNKLLPNPGMTPRFATGDGSDIKVSTSNGYLRFTFTPSLTANNKTNFENFSFWVRK